MKTKSNVVVYRNKCIDFCIFIGNKFLKTKYKRDSTEDASQAFCITVIIFICAFLFFSVVATVMMMMGSSIGYVHHNFIETYNTTDYNATMTHMSETNFGHYSEWTEPTIVFILFFGSIITMVMLSDEVLSIIAGITLGVLCVFVLLTFFMSIGYVHHNYIETFNSTDYNATMTHMYENNYDHYMNTFFDKLMIPIILFCGVVAVCRLCFFVPCMLWRKDLKERLNEQADIENNATD